MIELINNKNVTFNFNLKGGKSIVVTAKGKTLPLNEKVKQEKEIERAIKKGFLTVREVSVKKDNTTKAKNNKKTK